VNNLLGWGVSFWHPGFCRVEGKYENYSNDKTSYRTNNRQHSGGQQWFAGLPPEQQFPKFSEPILFHGIDFERCGDAIRQSLGFAKPSAAPYVSAGLREIWDTRWYGSCVSEPGRM
jgi:hypothetical protein